jgi:ketosteroid isomerase-like protein
MAVPGTRDVIDGIFADAATGDLEAVLRWWHDDGTLEDVTLAQAFVGKPALRAYLDMYYRALPEVRYEPIRLLVSGDTAMVEWMQTARVSGVFDGVEADGREVVLHAMDVFHVVDGLIVHEVSWYGDGWLRQRLEGVAGLPPALDLTPPLAADGTRFGADGTEWRA